MHVVLHAWVALEPGGGGVQGFRLKSRDFGQPVQGSALSRLASMHYHIATASGIAHNTDIYRKSQWT